LHDFLSSVPTAIAVHLQEDGCIYRYMYIQVLVYTDTCIYNETCKRQKIINKNINLEKVHFVGLYCIIILHCMVQKNIKFFSNVRVSFSTQDYVTRMFECSLIVMKKCSVFLPSHRMSF